MDQWTMLVCNQAKGLKNKPLVAGKLPSVELVRAMG
jgi:hypothetical protein